MVSPSIIVIAILNLIFFISFVLLFYLSFRERNIDEISFYFTAFIFVIFLTNIIGIIIYSKKIINTETTESDSTSKDYTNVINNFNLSIILLSIFFVIAFLLYFSKYVVINQKTPSISVLSNRILDSIFNSKIMKFLFSGNKNISNGFFFLFLFILSFIEFINNFNVYKYINAGKFPENDSIRKKTIFVQTILIGSLSIILFLITIKYFLLYINNK